jgi:allantoin racemase
MVKVAFVIGHYPPEELKRRTDVALSYATKDIEVGIVPVKAAPFIVGLSPAEIQLAGPAFIETFVEAEKLGYDAVVPLGMLDLGVDGGRSAVNIPVIGPCEAALHIASLLGDRFGGLVYNDGLLPMTQAIIRRYGMEHKMVGYGSCGFELPDIAANRDQVVENFVSKAKDLIKNKGADVIIPLGITQCPVHIKPDWLQKELGVPVVEGIGAPIRIAGMLAGLGLTHSRNRWIKSPTFSQKR